MLAVGFAGAGSIFTCAVSDAKQPLLVTVSVYTPAVAFVALGTVAASVLAV